MTAALILILLALAFFSTLRAVTAATIERLLWGMLASSIGLGLAVQLHGDGYYGLLMLAVFVLTDMMVYLFFRSLKLMPDNPARNARVDRFLRIFFLWVSFCGIAGIVGLVFTHSATEVWHVPASFGMGLLAERVWASDWLLVALPVLGMVVLVTGGFFLVRRER
jgi:hypothetical protein